MNVKKEDCNYQSNVSTYLSMKCTITSAIGEGCIGGVCFSTKERVRNRPRESRCLPSPKIRGPSDNRVSFVRGLGPEDISKLYLDFADVRFLQDGAWNTRTIGIFHSRNALCFKSSEASWKMVSSASLQNLGLLFFSLINLQIFRIGNSFLKSFAD